MKMRQRMPTAHTNIRHTAISKYLRVGCTSIRLSPTWEQHLTVSSNAVAALAKVFLRSSAPSATKISQPTKQQKTKHFVCKLQMTCCPSKPTMLIITRSKFKCMSLRGHTVTLLFGPTIAFILKGSHSI